MAAFSTLAQRLQHGPASSLGPAGAADRMQSKPCLAVTSAGKRPPVPPDAMACISARNFRSEGNSAAPKRLSGGRRGGRESTRSAFSNIAKSLNYPCHIVAHRRPPSFPIPLIWWGYCLKRCGSPGRGNWTKPTRIRAFGTAAGNSQSESHEDNGPICPT
jgi:hypothetical protein